MNPVRNQETSYACRGLQRIWLLWVGVTENATLRVHGKLFVPVSTAIGPIQVVQNQSHEDEGLIRLAVEAIDGLPWNIKSYLIRRPIRVFVIPSAPWRLRSYQSIIIGKRVGDLDALLLRFLLTRAVLLMRVRGDRRLSMKLIFDRHSFRIDSFVAKLLHVELMEPGPPVP